MEVFLTVFDIVGTIAFAASGAMVGTRKQMDMFGVCVLGVITSVGGGMTRDVLLGIHPPRIFSDSRDVLIAFFVSLVTFWIVYYLQKKHEQHPGATAVFNYILFAMDTLGLGVFTVIGIEVALEKYPEAGSFLLVFVGVITGVGGGVLRDMMSGTIPYIFQKHIYATACIVGALLCVLLICVGMEQRGAMFLGAFAIIVIRVLAASLHWDLPTIPGPGAEKKKHNRDNRLAP